MSKRQGPPRATSPRHPALAEAPTAARQVQVTIPEPTIDPQGVVRVEGVTVKDGEKYFRFVIADTSGVKFGHVPLAAKAQLIAAIEDIETELGTGLAPLRSTLILSDR